MNIVAERPLKPIWHILPSGWSIPFVLLGTAWVVLLGSCSGAATLANVVQGKPVQQEIETCFLLVGFGTLPVGALLIFVAALLAGRWAARTALLGLSLLATVVGLVSMLVSGLISDDPASGAAFSVILYAVPSVVLTVAFVVSALMAVKEVRNSIAEGRTLRISELLSARGEVSFNALSEEMEMPASAVTDLIGDLMHRQAILAVVDESSKMLFSPERYAHKQWDLVSVTYGRGEVGLDELSDELKLSEARLKELLVSAMRGGLFAGYVDWRRRKVISGDASRLRQTHQCPGCGSHMQLAGRDLVVCSYCGAEVFLS